MGDTLKSPCNGRPSARELAGQLPFRVGQTVETRSFSQGYRGAWFDCTIVEIDKGDRSYLRYKLKYVHFPEESLHWCKAYQQRYRFKAESTELMLRPLPPPIIHEADLPGARFEGIVIVPYAWEVGDLVNWWCDDVWWEATVTEISGTGKLKINLLKPPFGEGGVHVVKPIDLRPSLSWSLKDQWTVPISKKKANGRPAARIVDLSTKWLQKATSDQEYVATLGSGSSSRGFGPLQMPNGNGVVQNSADERRNQSMWTTATQSPELEFKSQRTSDVLGWRNSDCKIVPCLDNLRRAVEPLNFVNTDGADKGDCSHDGNVPNVPQRKEPKEEENNFMCTSSDSLDDDDEELALAMHLRLLIFKRRQRKFKRYRSHVNRAVDFLRRLRLKTFKTFILADCSIINSPNRL